MNTFTTLLTRTCSVFRAPSYTIFTELVTGWALAPGRRTITGMLAVAGSRAHDAYHRLLRDGAWAMSGLWRILAVGAVAQLAATGVISVDINDTLFHKTGRRIDGAGTFRDAVRSTARHIVYATGLNVVVLTLRVPPPWGGMPIALPINAGCTARATPRPPSRTPPRCCASSPNGCPAATSTPVPTVPTPPSPARTSPAWR